MRKVITAIASAALIAPLLSAPAFAQPGSATGQGFASARIIDPIAVRSISDLEFGGIAVSPNEDGAVAISPETGRASYTGSAAPVCTGSGTCSAAPALFEVTGEKNRSYVVDLPTMVFARPVGTDGPQLPVSSLRSVSKHLPGMQTRGFLDAAGSDEIRVGGTLAIPAGTPPGKYRAEVKLVVSYD